MTRREFFRILDSERFAFFREVYWTERTLDVVVILAREEDPVIIRIEALHKPRNSHCCIVV